MFLQKNVFFTNKTKLRKYLFVRFSNEKEEVFFDVTAKDLRRHLLGKLQDERHRLKLDEFAEILKRNCFKYVLNKIQIKIALLCD
jgi:hypothetical protein